MGTPRGSGLIVAEKRGGALRAKELGAGGGGHWTTVGKLWRSTRFVDRRKSRTARDGERARYFGHGRLLRFVGECESGRGTGSRGRSRLRWRPLDDHVAVERELLGVQSFVPTKVQSVEEVILVFGAPGLGRGCRCIFDWGRGSPHVCGICEVGGREQCRCGGRWPIALRLRGQWRRVRRGIFASLELVEACVEVERLIGQHEAVHVVVLALERHAAAHAWAHGRHGRAAASAGVASRSGEADAQAALAPIIEIVLVVGRGARRGRLELQALVGVGGQLQVIAPVVVDGDLAVRVLLAQAFDRSAKQRGRRHAGGNGDADLLGRRDGVHGRRVVVGGQEDLPVVVARVALRVLR